MNKIELEDLHAARRLRIGCPVYGNFWELKELHAKTTGDILPPVVNYQGGYYSPKYGRHFPYKVG